jgi:citrate synthase
VTSLGAAGHAYRGHGALALAGTRSFEAVAELLWTGRFPGPTPVWRARPDWVDTARRAIGGISPSPGRALHVAVAAMGAAGDVEPLGVDTARSAVASLAAVLGGDEPGSVATAVTRAVSPVSRPEDVEVVESALVLLADHGLAASTTAARLAGAYGAGVHDVLAAGLAVLAGPRHGAASTAAEGVLRSLLVGRSPEEVAAAARLGGVPGIGQPLYPAGDPRFGVLLDAVAAARADAPVLGVLDRLEVALARAGAAAPNVDMGIAALVVALGLVPGSGETIFAMGRTAGWLAHAIEAASQPPLRLRATYVGPTPRR